MTLLLAAQGIARGSHFKVISPGGHVAERADVVVRGQADLLHVVGAAHAVGGLAHFLHGWNQQAHQHRDDGDHHQQFNKGESTPSFHVAFHSYEPREG